LMGRLGAPGPTESGEDDVHLDCVHATDDKGCTGARKGVTEEFKGRGAPDWMI